MITKSKIPGLLGRHYFGFNERDNGGETVSLITKIFDEEPRKLDRPPNGTRTEQELCLNSYCNAAFIKLSGTSLITSDALRQVANELDKKLVQMKAKASKEPLPTDAKHGWISSRLAYGVLLNTTYHDNGDSKLGLPLGVFIDQQIVVEQGDIKSGFQLSGATLPPETLRKLANELDHFIASTLAV